MKLNEFYKKTLKPAVDEMNLVDVKIYPDGDGEVGAVLLKYVPGRGKEKADWEKYADMFEDGGKR